MVINLKVIIVTVVALILAFVITFNIIGNSSTTLTSAADSITDANNCSEGTDTTGTAQTYNFTDKNCYNTTSVTYTAGQYDLPLNTLFSRGGVVILVFMAMILIALVIIGLTSFKKK